MLYKYLQKGHLDRYLRAIGISEDINIDLLSLPDLVWECICTKNPVINCYPLGEVTERSWKKSFVWLLDHYYHCYDGLTDDQINNFNLEDSKNPNSEPIPIQDMIGRFLTNLLFELCMISLRSDTGKNADYGYAFQFKDGQLISMKEQITLRKKIEAECEQITASFIPYFTKSIDETKTKKKMELISEGIGETLPFIDWSPGIPKRHKKPTINVVVGTAQLSNLDNEYEVDSDYIRIILEGKSKNVAFSLDDIEKFLKHRIHSLTKDLLEISFVVYMADLYVLRNQNLSRSLDILIPVRHKDLWIQEKFHLQQVVSFLARDSVTFHFTQKKEKREKRIEFNLSNRNKYCTSLLSGGIDSAVGAVWAVNKGYIPTLVSYSPGNLSGIQSRLVSEIESCTKSVLSHLIISWQPSKRQKGAYRLGKSPGSLLFQHLRSFFYLGLAFSIAIESGHKKVFMFENGPIAINPLLSESHINTRTSHPVFLELYANLIKRVFGVDISLQNPFITHTKSQLISYIHNKGMTPQIVPNTSSCFSYARVKAYAKLWLDNANYVGTHDGASWTQSLGQEGGRVKVESWY